ncbi:MAG: hypothetical protein RL307_415, partial [Pseudomonadota bacterium]
MAAHALSQILVLGLMCVAMNQVQALVAFELISSQHQVHIGPCGAQGLVVLT